MVVVRRPSSFRVYDKPVIKDVNDCVYASFWNNRLLQRLCALYRLCLLLTSLSLVFFLLVLRCSFLVVSARHGISNGTKLPERNGVY